VATSHRNPSYPACGGDWSLTKYLSLFETLSLSLKSIDSQIPVGGPATQQLGWVEELRAYTLRNNVSIDFISTHQYPGDHQVPQTLEGHSDAIIGAAKQIGSDSRALPMYLTEYAINDHDSVAAAAGIISYIPRLSGVLPLYSYWAFSDIFVSRCKSTWLTSF
jgi:xylan 1,4-beta-xylosidase